MFSFRCPVILKAVVRTGVRTLRKPPHSSLERSRFKGVLLKKFSHMLHRWSTLGVKYNLHIQSAGLDYVGPPYQTGHPQSLQMDVG